MKKIHFMEKNLGSTVIRNVLPSSPLLNIANETGNEAVEVPTQH